MASRYTPSNSMLTTLFFQSAGARNVLRYQPIPPGKKPPPAPLGLSLSGLLSMLQSCGRSTDRQDASANEGASAPLGSPRKNFHPASAANSLERGLEFAALIETGTKHARSTVKRIGRRYESFMMTSYWCGPCRHSLTSGISSFVFGVPVELWTTLPFDDCSPKIRHLHFPNPFRWTVG